MPVRPCPTFPGLVPPASRRPGVRARSARRDPYELLGKDKDDPVSYSSSSQLAGKAADTDDGAGRSSFGIFSHPPSLMHCINSTHRDTNCLTSVINTMVEGVNGYGILTDIGTCLNHLKYPVTHNLISYRDYHQSLLLHMHSPLL